MHVRLKSTVDPACCMYNDKNTDSLLFKVSQETLEVVLVTFASVKISVKPRQRQHLKVGKVDKPLIALTLSSVSGKVQLHPSHFCRTNGLLSPARRRLESNLNQTPFSHLGHFVAFRGRRIDSLSLLSPLLYLLSPNTNPTLTLLNIMGLLSLVYRQEDFKPRTQIAFYSCPLVPSL